MTSKFAGLAMATDVPARMVIRNPATGQPLRDADGSEAFISLLSFDSKPGRAHDREVIDQQMRLGKQRMTSEQAEASLTEKLAKLTVEWHLVALDGTHIAVECTQANARELYGLAELSWLRQEVMSFASDLGNFRPAASRS